MRCQDEMQQAETLLEEMPERKNRDRGEARKTDTVKPTVNSKEGGQEGRVQALQMVTQP